MSTDEKFERFVKAIAAYITTDIAAKSIRLQMGDADSNAWAAAYSASGCMGWETAEEAEKSIRNLVAARNRSGEEGR